MLGKTEGRQQIGVVISLGRLADAEAVGPIAALLAQDHAELREVALVALGRIGTAPAAASLCAFAASAPDALRATVVDAELDAVDALCQHGEYATAVGICEALQTSPSERVQAAALRGLIQAKPAESLTLIVAGLAADQPWKQAVAADCVVQLRKPAELQVIAEAIPNLPPAGQRAAFASLQDRCDPSVRTAALQSLQDPDTAVQTAALAALIASGTPDDVRVLVELAASAADPAVRDAASETLRLMPAAGTNQALLTVLEQNTALQPTAIRCALSRRHGLFVPAFVQAAKSSSADARLQALLALEVMATPAEAETLVDLLSRTAPGEEREAADRAVWMSLPTVCGSGCAVRRCCVQHWRKSDAAGQCADPADVGPLGGAESLTTVHEAMQSTDPPMRDAGYRALANWPDDSVADELLDIAKGSDVEAYRIWSLRAYARVISLPSDRPPQTTFEMLCNAMDLAARTGRQGVDRFTHGGRPCA